MSEDLDKDELSPLQEKILILLNQGEKPVDIIKAVGVAKGTYYFQTRKPEFKAAYRRLRAENFEAAFSRMQNSLITDVKLLETIRDDNLQTAQTRMKAVRLLLEYSVNAYEREQLERRIAEVEEKLGINSGFKT